jgi:predicted permease
VIGLFTGFGTLVLIAVLGYVARKVDLVSGAAEKDLNRLVFYFALPAMVLASLLRSDHLDVFSLPVLVQTIAIAIAVIIFVIGNNLLPGAKEVGPRGVIATTAAYYANLGNIGMPVMIALGLGAEVMLPYILLQQIFFAPLTLGLLQYKVAGRADWRTLITMPVKNPLLLSAGLGVIVSLLDIPGKQTLAGILGTIGAGAVPMVMFAFGAGLVGRQLFAQAANRVIFATIVKSVLMPLIALLLSSAFGLTRQESFIAIVVAGLPTAQNVYNFSMKFERGVDFARGVMLLTTAVSPVVILLISIFVA